MGHPEKPPTKKALALIEKLRKVAFTYPETTEDHPWGHVALKVKGKVFVFLGGDGDLVTFSLKLPQSKEFALGFSCAEPTAYGMGKHGWVSAHTGGKDGVPFDVLVDWIDESWRAVAPKAVLKLRDANPRSEPSTPRRASRGRSSSRRAAPGGSSPSRRR